MSRFARWTAPPFASLPRVPRWIVLFLTVLTLLAACDPKPEEPEDPGEPCLDEGRRRCVDADRFETCTAGFWVLTEECVAPTPQCSVALGCIECGAGQDYCVDNVIYACSADGSSWSVVEDCGEDICRWGACYDPCELADEENTYLGCEFLAIPTANSQLPMAFQEDFAVVVGNPDAERSAEVRVARGGSIVQTAVVGPSSTLAISLEDHDNLKYSDGSRLVTGAAYEVLTDIPVVAYQYNPLNFQIGGGNYSYTNDASLLLPVAALGRQHLVSAWPTWGIIDWEQWLWSPGWVAITSPTDGNGVYLTSSAYTMASVIGEMPAIQALEPGHSVELTLNRGDVLQVFSRKGSPQGSCEALSGAISGVAPGVDSWDYPVCLDIQDGDLTGTWVTAGEPIAVFAGHDCSFVPFDAWACDHLEESVLPLEVWGGEAVVSAPVRPGGGGNAPTIIRVLAQYDGTEVRFLPEIHEPVIAGPAQAVELRVEEDVVVTGGGRPILVTQLLLGEQELGANAGDPALGTMPPTNHWRQAYEFLVPATYEDNYVNLVSRIGARIYLDDQELLEWALIDETPFQVHRAHLQPGEHSVYSDSGGAFSLVAYGYASYTSYLYPGGLDLTHNLNP